MCYYTFVNEKLLQRYTKNRTYANLCAIFFKFTHPRMVRRMVVPRWKAFLRRS